MAKQKILIFIDWYYPGYKGGGPIRSCRNLIANLKPYFDFKVITRDTDWGGKEPYPEIKSNQWIKVSEGEEVMYISGEMLSVYRIGQLLKNESCDRIYFNSLFSFYFTIVPLFLINLLRLKKKITLAPRGMLGKGSLSIKPIKKKIFLALAKWTGLYRNVHWHATGEQEEIDIRSCFGNDCTVKIAPNLSSGQNFVSAKRVKVPGTLRLVFISRIHRIKNLRFALETLKSAGEKERIEFDIYGTVEDKLYWKECSPVINSLPRNIRVNYVGELLPDEIHPVLGNYHFLFLPTLHENFGHIILESFLAGCPVIISDLTPWKGLEEKGAGWDIPLTDKSKFESVIKQCLAMKQTEYDRWSGNAFKLGFSFATDSRLAEKSRLLFTND